MRLKIIFGMQVARYKIESLDLFFLIRDRYFTLILDDKYVIAAVIILEINPFHAFGLFLPP